MGTLVTNAQGYVDTEHLTEVLGSLKSLNRKAHRSSKYKENKDRQINEVKIKNNYMSVFYIYEIFKTEFTCSNSVLEEIQAYCIENNSKKFLMLDRAIVLVNIRTKPSLHND